LRGHPHRTIASTLELSFHPTLQAPGQARAAVSAWLAHEPHDVWLTDIAALLVSELMTNSVRHAHMRGEEPLSLNASLCDATLRLEVRDSGTAGTVARRTPRQDLDAGGFGLDLVARLSTSWGIERDGRGTTVWLELPTEKDAATFETGTRGAPRRIGGDEPEGTSGPDGRACLLPAGDDLASASTPSTTRSAGTPMVCTCAPDRRGRPGLPAPDRSNQVACERTSAGGRHSQKLLRPPQIGVGQRESRRRYAGWVRRTVQ
jgi:anti-sigma regulatory factor (Ser/Thr protein kinase)